MQILGLALLAFIVWFGFGERTDTTISAFDTHAMVMVLGGSFAAILVSSTTINTLRTFSCLRELLPGLGTLRKGTTALEEQRMELVELWRQDVGWQFVGYAVLGPSYGGIVTRPLPSLLLCRLAGTPTIVFVTCVIPSTVLGALFHKLLFEQVERQKRTEQHLTTTPTPHKNP